MSVEVIRPGLLMTIQDRGRYGMQQYGVPVSGAMDPVALRIANMLVGNNEEESVLEITLQGPELLFRQGLLIAVTGGDLEPFLDGMQLPMNRPVYVNQGSTLTFRGLRDGCRAYLAVAGGFDAAPKLGSRSTYVRAGIGGIEGRALIAGDTLQTGAQGKRSAGMAAILKRALEQKEPNSPDKPFAAADWFVPQVRYGERRVIRLIPGTHYDNLTAESRKLVLSEPFSVAPQSDRMGYRLNGAALSLAAPLELLSEGVACGTVQLPPSGQPIILLADRQTTGGYPRIAQVAAVDWPIVAQFKPGDRFGFTLITQAQAEQLLIERELALALMSVGIHLKMESWRR